MTFPFDNSYSRLPDRFFQRIAPTVVSGPQLIRLNEPLARELGLDPEFLRSPAGVEILAGNQIAEGSDPIALAYAGHQFGNFVPQLGDGRAILLGELVSADGQRRDIQLKGPGRTAFSRQGDGRAALGPVLREYIVSEAMAALGIATTRSLAAVSTGEKVWRETVQPGAVLTRIAASHVRIGTFQFFAARGDVEGLRILTDHVIARHYPEAARSDTPELELLRAVAKAQARLIAQWMLIGFIHGVMNTDNVTISGETLDYGPCAFMDRFNPATVFSSIDHAGRYAYGNQPAIGLWNLVRLAECLLPLIADETERAVPLAQAVLEEFDREFETAFLAGMRKKLGLASEEAEDKELVNGLFAAMYQGKADFTLTFRRLGEGLDNPAGEISLKELFSDSAPLEIWLAQWRQRLERDALPPAHRGEAMRLTNPLYIARNHLVEAALTAAATDNDFNRFNELVDVLAQPFTEQPGKEIYTRPPEPHEQVLQTFCGT
ncbi:YdiU family protein [Aureimonas fodinaquatilis]|uniref:Protein nucleotidyltransferase YdiU n=1 Tax=Aureimonas fodinaquatilis TaxID=2565783 RepID=A0A5B0DT12_9HYPH|nr:YdiU family protein [Aureimonas fodinaquatilis]KAA0969538.1 YdiU family protein [Aureimonas fodinaquatilis]